MIGTAFSVLIKLELSSPRVKFLQGDHQLFNIIISAHAFIMSTPFHSISTCSLASKGANLCVVGMIIYLINLYTAFLPGLIEPKKTIRTISVVVEYSYILRTTPYKETNY